MANIFEIIDDFSTNIPQVNNPLDILIILNPTNSKITVDAGKDIFENRIVSHKLLGQEIEFKMSWIN